MLVMWISFIFCILSIYIFDYPLHIYLITIHTWPCIFIITTVLLRLQTTKWSGFFAIIWILLTAISAAPRDLNVFIHSVVFILHIFTVPSDEALKEIFIIKKKHIKIYKQSNLITLCPSCVYITSLTKDVWPRNSFSVLPDFSPWILQIRN